MQVAEILRPYLEGSGPNEVGEWGMHCPLHDDTRRSASVNFVGDVWYCHACERGGSVKDLLKIMSNGGGRTPPPNGATRATTVVPTAADDLPSYGTVAGWAAALRTNVDRLREITSRRGLTVETLQEFDVGWDESSKAYTIPVYGEDGDLTNVRRYQFDVPDDRRKIWSVRGHGAPALYPLVMLQEDASTIIICEGEWDALLTIQNGFTAVTRTAAADVWNQDWNNWFRDKTVYICHDMDEKGQRANVKIAREVQKVAKDIAVITLPFPVTSKHGKDLTDFWQEYGADDFRTLIDDSESRAVEQEAEDISLLDSLGTRYIGKSARLRLTVTGRKSVPNMAPAEVSFTCEKDAGIKCAHCPMNENRYNGSFEIEVPVNDPKMLRMFEVPQDTLEDFLRKRIGAVKCGRMVTDIRRHYPVEVLFVRPDIESDINVYDPGSYQSRKVYSIGKHDTLPNTTVEAIGSVYPHPRNQDNTFLAHQVNEVITSLDKYEMDEKMFVALQEHFSTEDPLRKCIEISKELSSHVTKIYGRPEMHVLMDLVWHSVLGFEFEGLIQNKGWLDVLIVGDTRTGKSEAAERLLRHYHMGQMISCEASSFAGIVGGLDRHSDEEWTINWGIIPLNDRRLVVLDEVSGFQVEDIGRMSGIRSSGVADLTKIRTERTFARTRLLWMGNPRDGNMDQYLYGVHAIKPLIGNNEDVARFDLAMTLKSSDIPSNKINRDHAGESEYNPYTSELCHNLLLWVWSRKPHQVFWMYGAQDLIWEAAIEMGKRYVSMPPLIQAANVRIKIARVAIALAARTFSTLDGENLLVTNAHVEDAVRFINRLYEMDGFGYAEYSRRILEDEEHAKTQIEATRAFVHNEGLWEFLVSESAFRRQDLQDMLNMEQGQASMVISTLFSMKMIRREAGDYRVNPILHSILREQI